MSAETTDDLNAEHATGSSSPPRGLNILLAEDTRATRELMGVLLEREGHTVTFAENGRVAVEKWESGDYDIILMDIQMPEMDGIEASTMIRDRERERAGSRTPIIAVTAVPLDECRDGCVAAGMDDFVSKPIDINELAGKISTHAYAEQGERPAGFAESIRPLADSGQSYDLSSVKEILADDHDEIVKLVKMFFRVVRERMDALEQAVSKRNSEEAYIAAHTIKGMASQFGAEPMRLVALEMEKAAKAGGMENLDGKLKSLTLAFEEVKKGLSMEYGLDG